MRLVEDITHPAENVRSAAAEALATLIKTRHSAIVGQVLEDLLRKYAKLNEIQEPKRDQFGRVTEAAVDEWQSRAGIGHTLHELAECVPSESVAAVFEFLVRRPSALNDRNAIVRNRMLEASIGKYLIDPFFSSKLVLFT